MALKNSENAENFTVRVKKLQQIDTPELDALIKSDKYWRVTE